MPLDYCTKAMLDVDLMLLEYKTLPMLEVRIDIYNIHISFSSVHLHDSAHGGMESCCV